MNTSLPANLPPARQPGWPRVARATLLGLLALLTLLASAYAQEPTAIDVQYFRVSLQGTNVLLEWRTGTEIDTGGFQVWRSEVANDPGRGVMVEDFPPQGDTAGYTYQYTDAGVDPGMTYYYTLVAYDLYGNESPFPSEPPAITIGQAQSPATATPTQPVPTATQPPPTATPTAVSGLQPITPGASGAFITSTPTFTPFPGQATVQPATPPPPALAPAALTPQVIPTAAVAAVAVTPAPPAPAAAPATPGTLPQQERLSAAQAATPVAEAGITPAAPAPTVAPQALLPTRGPRPTPPPAPATARPQAILGVIALGSVATALLIAGLMVLVWLRWRSGG